MEETGPLGFREPAGTGERLEKSRLHSQRVCRCWLINEQGRESPAPWLPPHRAAESKWGNTPALPTPHHILALDLEQTGPGRRLSPGTHRRLWGAGPGVRSRWGSSSSVGANSVCTTEAAQMADSSTAPQFPSPRCPNSQLQPSERSAPAHSTPQPHPRSHNTRCPYARDCNKGRNATWAVSEWCCTRLTGSTSDLCEHRASLTSALLSTLEGNRLLKPNPQHFCCSRWGAHPTLDRPGRATAQRKFHLTHCTGFTPSNTNHAPYQGDSGQHTLRKDVAGVYIKISPHAKDTG